MLNVARDPLALPAILTDGKWTFTWRICGADENSPLDQTGQGFRVTFAPTRIAQPLAADVHTFDTVTGTEVTIAGADVTVTLAGSAVADWSPHLYVVELSRKAGSDWEPMVLATVPVIRGASALATKGGGGPLPAAASAVRAVVTQGPRVVVLGPAAAVTADVQALALAAAGSAGAAAGSATAAGDAAGLAANWASLVGAFVTGSLLSAREWAVGTWKRGVAGFGSAKDWATLLGATVDDAGYSAKEHAVGTTTPTGSAKDWATKTAAEVVPTQGYGAKKYAQDAAGSASAADADAQATAADRVQTGQDRVATGQDRTATGQDRVQTGLDRAAAAASAQAAANSEAAVSFPVSYHAQVLAAPDKAQACANIGAVPTTGGTMTGSLLATDGVPDLGDATHRWRKGYFSSDVSAGAFYVPVTTGGYAVNAAGTASVYGRTGSALTFYAGSTAVAEFPSNTVYQLRSAAALAWSSGEIGAGSDTGFSRGAAGQVNLGNGTPGSSSGTLSLAGIILSGQITLQYTSTSQAGIECVRSSTVRWRADQQQFVTGGLGVHGWGSSATDIATVDTGFSRTAAGAVALGNGTQGDFSGTLRLTQIQLGASGSITATMFGPGGTGASSKLVLGNDVGLQNGATARPIGFDADRVNVASQASFGWARTGTVAWTDTAPDLTLYKDAADIMAQRRGLNPQTFRLYNTITDASNYERVSMGWGVTANVFVIKFEPAGTGSTNRGMVIDAVGGGLTLQTNSQIALRGGPSANHNLVFAGASNLFGPSQWDNNIDLGSASFRWRDAYLGRNLFLGGYYKSGPFTVATLPSASAAGAGAKTTVTDATTTAPGGAVVGGGSNVVDVISTGAAWNVA